MTIASVLERPVLQLNRNWLPIRVVSVRNAIIKLYEGVARAVLAEDYSVYDFDEWSKLSPVEGDPKLQSAHLFLRVPEVIVLCKYGEIPDRKMVFTRANIYRRDKYTCQYCGARPGMHELTIDHVLPVSRGGKSSWTNCVLACISCNFKKANRLPEEAGMKLKHRPVKPDWSPRLVLAKVRNTPKNWEKFVSEAY